MLVAAPDGGPMRLLHLVGTPVVLLCLHGSGEAQTLRYTVTGDRVPDGLGNALDLLQDITGDGVPELVAGASAAAGGGRVTIHSGRSGGLLLELFGGVPGFGFGHSVAAPGDINLDGVPDIVVGIPEYGPPIRAGRAMGFSSDTGAVVFDKKWFFELEEYGTEVQAMGKTSGNGLPVFIVETKLTKRFTSWPGCPYPILVGSGGIAPAVSCSATEDPGEYGPTGDVNDDEVDDYFITNTPTGSAHAVARVCAGGTNNVLDSIQHAQLYAGVKLLDPRVHRAPDFTGDGVPEYAFTYVSTGSVAAGMCVDVRTLAPGPAAVTLIRTDIPMLSMTGVTFADIDDDGTPDVLISQPEWDPGLVGFTRNGRVLALNGRPPHDVIFELRGRDEEQLGQRVMSLGDIDGDGPEEFVVAVPEALQPDGSRRGELRVYSP